MRLETYYKLSIHDADGKLVKDSGLTPSHSYVIQFLELIEGFFKSADGGDKLATDVTNAESIIYDYSEFAAWTGAVNAAIGDDTFGTVVGTGDAAESNEDYDLETKIAHSAVGAAGCLNYQAVTFVPPVVDAPNVDFDVTRTFLNESGATITVEEIGIICKNTANTKYHLLLRDVVADEAVLDGFTLTVVYTLRTTV